MEPEGSLPHSHQPDTCSYPDSARSYPCPQHSTSWRSILTYCRRATQKCVIALPCVVDGSCISAFPYTTSCTCVCKLVWLTFSARFIDSLMQDAWVSSYIQGVASGTQGRGFKPGRSRWIFTKVKILSMPSVGGEVKESVPCPSFAAWERT
jgi:hypothetical protein